jgi:hypothetical protein
MEVLRLLGLAGGCLEDAYRDMVRFDATRAEGRVVNTASMVCAAGLPVKSVPDSEAHWTIAAGLRIGYATLEGISDPRVRPGQQDMVNAESICQDGLRAQ